MLAWIGQRSCGCPKPQSVQSQVGQGFEEPDLVIDVPADGRGAGKKNYILGSFQPWPFYDF